MQLADCLSVTHSAATDGASRPISGLNQNVYQRLKLSLSLNLRRQIFVAVCDDLALRNRLAAQLYAELAYPAHPPTPTLQSPPTLPERLDSPAAIAADGIRTDTLAVGHPASVAYPRLVSLNLNLGDPNPMVQIGQWLAQYPPPKNIYPKSQPPGFQILGAERLTRQPATVQKQFLQSLQQIEQYLPQLESALLLWLPRPWFHAIQQSAPAFWICHTALFEFEGDPTPVPISAFNSRPTVQAGTAPGQPQTPPPSHETTRPQKRNPAPAKRLDKEKPKEKVAPVARPSSPTAKSTQPSEKTGAKITDLKGSASSNVPVTHVPVTHVPVANTPGANAPVSRDDLWDILAQDLAQLKEEQELEQGVALPASTEPPLTQHNPLPYQPHSVQDLAELVLTVAMQDDDDGLAENHAELLQILEQIEQLHLQKATSEALAEAYRSLGNLYRDRVEQGDDSEYTLLIAICAYEQVLHWLDDASLLWSDVLNDIGNLYWMLSRSGKDTQKTLAHLERAIAAYQYGLTRTHPQTRSQSYAMIQNNLGSAFGDLARYRSPVDALEQSVLAYEEALRYRKLEEEPARYAATQNNLGTAYWNLAQHHQPVRCLKQAIAAYSEALNYYSPDCEPIHYAMIQNNLGTAFWNLAQHQQSAPDEAGGEGQHVSPADWLLRAIAAYRKALKYRTVEIVPSAYAATQNNLGTAHWHLANLSSGSPDERREHLQAAIAAYKSAVAAVNYLATASIDHAPALTFDPAATHNNLGLAYYQIALDKQGQNQQGQNQQGQNQQGKTGESKQEYLEAALSHHLQALQGWQQNPDFYQAALGYVLQTVRAFHSELGTKGQNLALSKVPSSLLPEIMKRL